MVSPVLFLNCRRKLVYLTVEAVISKTLHPIYGSRTVLGSLDGPSNHGYAIII